MKRKRICLLESPLDTVYSSEFWRGAQWAHDVEKAVIKDALDRYSPIPIVSVGYSSVLEGAFLVRALNEKKTELEKAYSEILDLSHRDSLTGLLNRRAFQERLLGEKRRMDRYSSKQRTTFSLLFMDIDDFKYFNDTFGHDVGDSVLKTFAEMLTGLVRTTDVVARLGGDEFVVLLAETKLDEAEILAGRILERLQEKDHIEKRIEELSKRKLKMCRDRSPRCSIGISRYDLEKDPDAILKRADNALYRAKAEGKGRYCIGE
jgi:diguanylate cyclase (GGDEF)-like protein